MIKGLILTRKGERARVKVDFSQTTDKKLPTYLDAWNPINANQGDKVEVEYQEFDHRKAMFITKGLPVMGIVAGLAFGKGMADFFEWSGYLYSGGIAAFAVLWFLVALNYSKVFKRDAVRAGKQPVVVAIDPVEFEIDMSRTPGE